MPNQQPPNSRLLLSKYLYTRGATTLRGNGIFDPGIATSLFQDAVELALVSAAELFHSDVNDKTGFLGIWDAASGAAVAAGKEKIPLRTPMKALNEARIGFKHLGNRVERTDAESYRVNAERVLAFISSTYFDQEFEKLSLISYVQEEGERQALLDSRDKLLAGDKAAALTRCADALSLMNERSSWFYRPGILVQFPDMDANALAYVNSQIGHLRGHVSHVERLLMTNLYGVPPIEFFVLDYVLEIARKNPPESAQKVARGMSSDMIHRLIDILALNSIGISDRRAEAERLIPGQQTTEG